MEFSEVVRRRRMVRRYSDKTVSRDQIERIVRAARRAPSAGFTQGQSFVVVTGRQSRDRVAEIGGQPAYTEKGFEPWISRAPALIICCVNPSAYRFRYKEPDKKGTAGAGDEWPVPWWFIDAGCSMMGLLLAAVDEGLSAGFLGFKAEGQNQIRDLLGIPEQVMPIGVVTIGHAAGNQRKGSTSRGWKPEAQVIHWDRWSGPA